MKVYINIGPATEDNYVDYTKYVLDGSLTVEDSVNVPTITTFQLAAIDDTMVVPPRSSYIRIVSEIYAEPSGYLGAGQTAQVNGKVLATGFITNQAQPQFLGLNPGLPSRNNQQLSYNINVTSDEWLLNSQTIPYIPAFVNQTDSEILAGIAEALMPGFFDTSGMGTGVLVPYYQYDPSQTWSDIAKTFADQNRYYYRVKDRRIIYQPFGVNDPILPAGLGIAYDETTQPERALFPLQMKTTVVTVPPVNDCIVIGDIEPQNNVDCYFVGDGFTSNFQLNHQVFQGTSSNLLEDDWTESTFSTGTWIVNDPEDTISLADSNGNALGALNVVQKGTSQVYTPIQNATFVQAQNGLELGGGLNLQHGQIIFNDTASGGGGLIGGIFEETTDFSPANCLAGFSILGQPSLGAFTVFQVQATGAIMAVALSISGTNTLVPGNVFSCAGFGGASWLNGQSLFITSIVQYTGYFVLTCTPENPGIIPGNYGPTNDNGTITFGANATIVTASGAAGIYMQPLYNGSVTGSPVVSQPNHQYVLQTWIGAEAPTRFTRPFTNLTRTATYGAQNLASSGTISWVITDVNLGNYVVQEQFPLFGLFAAAPPPVVTQFSAGGLYLPPFAIYVLLSGLDLNVAINYTLLSLPPQGFLTVQSLTGMSGGSLPWLPSQLSVPIPYQLGFGMINQTAQISLQGEVYALSFYTDDIPSVGARLRFQSWSAGQSIARVQDPGAIASEARISGDSGIRSALMLNLSPLPRTSLECEAAAAAAILDREYPQWQGSYTVQTNPYNFLSLFSPSVYGYPHTGLFFWIYSPVRGVTSLGLQQYGEGGFGEGGFGGGSSASGLNFFVNTVRFQVVELRGETLTISIDYGPDLYLDKLLPSFLEQEQNLLVPTQTVPPPNPITLPEVLNASLPTFNSALVTTISNSLTGNYIVVDLSGGTEPNAANSNATILALGATGCEVRYVDNGWGTPGAGRIGIFTVDQFTLPRTVRDQTFYLRGIGGPVGGTGFTPIVSKWSKALRIVYPLIPSAPALVSANATTIVADFAGDVRDIYGLELRALAASGFAGDFIVELPEVTPINTITYMARYANNALPSIGSQPEPSDRPNVLYSSQGAQALETGDIVYVLCPTDASFVGFRIVGATGNIGLVGSAQWVFTWEYGNTYPEQRISAGHGFSAQYPGTVQLVSRNGYANVISGTLVNNVATITTQQPHNLAQGQLMVLGAAYVSGSSPTFIPPYSHSTLDSSIFTTTAVVASVIDAHHFTYNVNSPDLAAGGGVSSSSLIGFVAGFSSNVLAFPFTVPGAPAGTLLQRVVTAPSDLVIDLTQPDIAATLSLLESLTPGSRVGGLALYFFNLTWDYSAGTPIPSFVAPVVSGLVIVQDSQNLSWAITQGLPDGHRVETFDVVTGETYSKYTIDHPSNPQLLTQAPIPAADWLNPRVFKVTPFDALGDGMPSFVVWGGSSGVPVIGGGSTALSPSSGAILTSFGSYGVNTDAIIGPTESVSPVIGVANQLFLWKMVVTQQITISSVAIYVFGNNSTSTMHIGVGIYSLDGSELLANGSSIATIPGSTNVDKPYVARFTPVTLTPGVYWVAQTADQGGSNVGTVAGNTRFGVGPQALLAAVSLKVGIAGNVSVAGVLPATLGGVGPIPGSTTPSGFMLMLFE